MTADERTHQGHGEKRSRKEEAAIAALLEQPTLKAAALAAGISEATLFRWLQDPEFSGRYRAARRAALSRATARLQHASAQAVETLMAVMSDAGTPASARVTAARTVLELAARAVEIEDLQAKIALLERVRRRWQ
jgi:hypothetical protein